MEPWAPDGRSASLGHTHTHTHALKNGTITHFLTFYLFTYLLTYLLAYLLTCLLTYLHVQVGAGLPLDALKKGTIVEWVCPYKLEGPEIPPLLDALSRNSSLVKLDMAPSGITWTGSGAAGAPLLEQMSQSAAPLSSLESLVISSQCGGSQCGYQIPVRRLRMGSEVAMGALVEAPFFSAGGPWRQEIDFIAALLRRSSNLTVYAYETDSPHMHMTAATELQPDCHGPRLVHRHRCICI